ncbi:MAG: TIM barrel protein [Clostridiales bacterium]|nr:TIM barrel protein [Clostridiales bacterium]
MAKRKSAAFLVGVDSYSLSPLQLSPFEVLEWVERNGGEGVQFSEVNLPRRRALDRCFLNELAACASEKGLYLEWGGGEHIPFDLETGTPKDIFKVNRRAAEQAHTLGVRVVRSCSGGLMRWQEDSLPTEVFLRAMAKSLRSQKKMLNDFGVILALETHFEFTTFELRRLFEMCEAEPRDYLGICLDTMNLLTMIEDPVRGAQRVLPWVVMTHIKDGGILIGEKGLVSFPVEAGTGVVELSKIFRSLLTLETPVNISLEDHGGDFLIPVFEPGFLLRFPDLTAVEFAQLLALANQTKKMVEEGKIAILDRSRWPEVCEARVKAGLHHLKNIAAELKRQR